jgi:hypothetical protein
LALFIEVIIFPDYLQAGFTLKFTLK